MNKKLLHITIYAFIAFCVISYLSVMAWLLFGNRMEKPVANIGFPFKYYYQFWTSGADSPNCGWRLEEFVLDCLITWVVSAVVYFQIKAEG